jgi:hypothetical protein
LPDFELPPESLPVLKTSVTVTDVSGALAGWAICRSSTFSVRVYAASFVSNENYNARNPILVGEKSRAHLWIFFAEEIQRLVSCTSVPRHRLIISAVNGWKIQQAGYR